MRSTPLDYRSPDVSSPRRSTSAIVSVVASSLALVIGLGTYAFVAAPAPNKMYNQAVMAEVFFLICAPAFVVAVIAALVSACSLAKKTPALPVACLLILIQLI